MWSGDTFEGCIEAWIASQHVLSHPCAGDALVCPVVAEFSEASQLTNSSSPVKRPYDLLALNKPVRWVEISENAKQLEAAVAATENANATKLWQGVRRLAQGRLARGMFPLEIGDAIRNHVGLVSPEDDFYFAEQEQTMPAPTPAQIADERRDLESLFGGTAKLSDESVRRSIHRSALRAEFASIQDIVRNTKRFAKGYSEAAWNEDIHRPMLRLATQRVPGVGIYNMTRASIARPYIPQMTARTATEEAALSAGGKMIDYAMALSFEDGQFPQLHSRVIDFINDLSPKTFNNSTYPPLAASPTGVFVETKAESTRYDEGNAQLGLWLASWLSRITAYPSGSGGHQKKLPFVPLLLVVGKNWELFFGFDNEDNIEVLGPLQIGGTGTMVDAYRLLAVLRLLADWVAGGFRDWVEDVIDLG